MRLTREPILFYCFLFYVVVWYLQLGERWADRTGGLRIEALIAVFLLFVTTVDSFRREPGEAAGFAPYIFLYFLVLAMQTVFSWDSTHSWVMFKDRVIKYSVLALLTCRFVRTTNQLKWFILVWLLVCLKVTVEGVVGGITGAMIWQNQGIPRLHGSGLYGHPNSLSQLALGTLPFIYFLYPVFCKVWWKVFLIGLLVGSLYCILYTGSRTGYLGVIVSIGYLFFLVPSNTKIKFILSLFIIIPLVVQVAPVAYKERFISAFSGKEAAGNSKEGRKKMYGQGWEIFMKHPLGVGVGNYHLANVKYNGFAQSQHCLYLEILTETGLQGFIVFTALLLKIAVVLRGLKVDLDNMTMHPYDPMDLEKSENMKFVLAVVNALIVYLLVRLFVDIFGMDLYGICWWFVIGTTSSLFLIVSRMKNDNKSG